MAARTDRVPLTTIKHVVSCHIEHLGVYVGMCRPSIQANTPVVFDVQLLYIPGAGGSAFRR